MFISRFPVAVFSPEPHNPLTLDDSIVELHGGRFGSEYVFIKTLPMLDNLISIVSKSPCLAGIIKTMPVFKDGCRD